MPRSFDRASLWKPKSNPVQLLMWMDIANRYITHSSRLRRQRKEIMEFIPKAAAESAVAACSDITGDVYWKDVGLGLI